VIPAVVLAIIAVPTVRTIFRTQGAAPAGALQIEVVGHQWWWEFNYPEYGFTTANEVYMPIGRAVNFQLKTHDVIHSFWIPALGGKRDLVNNRTNHIWFTPDSTTEDAFNGFCAEYCGTSHANMRFRAFTVTAEQFASWVAHQQLPTRVPPPAPAAPAAAQAPGRTAATPAQTTPPVASAPTATQAGFIGYPADRMPAYTIPQTPIPATINFDASLQGDVARGRTLVTTGACLGCHFVKGEPTMVGRTGPDLTHVGTRLTIGGGLFPNDTRHLGAWIKNARAMKPGVFMPTQGKGQYDPITKTTLSAGYTDQQIADMVAYLQALK
jgi:cytochrome c oxidase subunit 2